MAEGRFRKHFRKAPVDTWNENMVQIHEFLDLSSEDRSGKLPYLWAVDSKNHLSRVLVAEELVRSCDERRQFWHQLKGLAGKLNRVDVNAIIAQTQAEMAQKLTQSLLAMATSGTIGNVATIPAAAPVTSTAEAGSGLPDWEPAWVDSPKCTTCDECLQIAPKVFQYNAEKQSMVVDPKGSTYRDIVRAAEKCTASCIHPGTPWDPNEKDVEKLLKRAAKYQ